MPHDPVFRLSDRITLLPVMHGTAQSAVAVRRLLLEEPFDCLAVPLPASFQTAVEAGIHDLPRVSVVVQQSSGFIDSASGATAATSYVPIDPCQPVIAALRLAIEEQVPRAFIDLETEDFQAGSPVWPDPYAIRDLGLARFSAGIVAMIPEPANQQTRDRIQFMSRELRLLERTYRKIVAVVNLADWPWIRDAFRSKSPSTMPSPQDVSSPVRYGVSPNTLQFLLSELPFVTAAYEQARRDLDEDDNLGIDGVKGLLLSARTAYMESVGKRARQITPQMLRTLLQYARNLSLVERRLTPDLYTLVLAARQVVGDRFAISLAEVSRTYSFGSSDCEGGITRFSVNRMQLPDGSIVKPVTRLPGPAVIWKKISLKKQPMLRDKVRWQMGWNPYEQCSWPPEDVAIERFRTHVKDKALSILGTDLARTEKFSTSLMDGLDIRETLRNWHTGDLFVKLLPPARGSLDCVVMLFDSPADPRKYPWRTTWIAEHHDESTLALFATDFRVEMVGPGIGLATYGGALFLFPPRPVSDIWNDRRLNFAETLEERLLAAACLHSRERHIALLSEFPPGAGWRRLARRFGKKFIHVPLSHFSQQTLEQLKMVHVLNGKQIRSFADQFIRRA